LVFSSVIESGLLDVDPNDAQNYNIAWKEAHRIYIESKGESEPKIELGTMIEKWEKIKAEAREARKQGAELSPFHFFVLDAIDGAQEFHEVQDPSETEENEEILIKGEPEYDEMTLEDETDIHEFDAKLAEHNRRQERMRQVQHLQKIQVYENMRHANDNMDSSEAELRTEQKKLNYWQIRKKIVEDTDVLRDKIRKLRQAIAEKEGRIISEYELNEDLELFPSQCISLDL